jgi:hypothetical protein
MHLALACLIACLLASFHKAVWVNRMKTKFCITTIFMYLVN